MHDEVKFNVEIHPLLKQYELSIMHMLFLTVTCQDTGAHVKIKVVIQWNVVTGAKIHRLCCVQHCLS